MHVVITRIFTKRTIKEYISTKLIEGNKEEKEGLLVVLT